ncbi:dUTP diphosphatase [Salipaludibacillus sp. LMS25]|jgi:dimeric dUTPase (all-alpha-NTP-PPase superfamily)|uniref:dUTP diphosphatase n=1 Tax=Salipaludibacillus sp. LMS25 TaxID=2924031 RepID=UPI0020D1D329|nr:dUTP diphosphatase [Salipaludibacillus sp. LMS25]UTR15558.1 dUTP diphosphatase [Salipaludibacillus sp. LMS25]
MNFSKLFEMQKTLDTYIETKQGLHDEALLERKLLALQVELAELANETRCFKFWSTKGPSERDVILEEYVDGIHFILSIGLEYGYDKTCHCQYPESVSVSKEVLVTDFFNVTDKLLNLRKEGSKNAFEALFTSYLTIGAHLGFSGEDVEQAYMKKNDVNKQRQDQGY